MTKGVTQKIVTMIRGPIVSTEKAMNNEATPSIAFAYLRSFVEHYGYETHLVDAIAEGLNIVWPLTQYPGYVCQGLTFDEMLERIPENSGVLAFSVMFSGEWPVNRAFIQTARKKFPKALFVAGGEHVTALTEYSLKDCPELDVCVKGEGEQTLVNILNTYFEGKELEQSSGNFMFRGSEGLQHINTSARILAIDKIPWPKWEDGYLEKFWKAGKSYGVQTARDMPIMASRGCPYKCTFCSNSAMWTTRYILRNVDDVLAEIEHYIKRYNITSLQFYDLTAITKRSWTLDFCGKLEEKKLDISWSLPSGTRSEVLDETVLKLLKKTGCSYLVYAPESGSKETLVKIKKQIDKKTFTESVLEAKKQGLVLRTNLIIGFPHENFRNILDTIKYGLYLSFKGVDEVTINIFSPYPGTEIFRELVDKGKVTVDDNYFLQLTSLNSDFTSTNPLTVNPNFGPRQLAFCRLAFLMLNYIVGYVFYPSRIFRTLKNIFMHSNSTTVLEHRLKDAISRRKAKKAERFKAA